MGCIKVLETMEHPLLAKGVVVVARKADRELTYVLCSLDWMELHNTSYDYLRERIADSAGTTPSLVAVQCLHQHTAPAFNSDVHQLLLAENNPRRVATARYLAETATSIATAIRDARQRLQAFTHIALVRLRSIE